MPKSNLQGTTTRRAAATRRNDENAVSQPIRTKTSLSNLGQAQRTAAAAPAAKKPTTTTTAKVGTKRAALAGVNGNVKEEVEDKKSGMSCCDGSTPVTHPKPK